MKRKLSKTRKKKIFALLVVTAFFVGYFMISASYYAYKIFSLKHEEKELEEEIYNLKEDEIDLKTDIEKLQNPDYLARYARENYHYSKKGELVIQRGEKEEEEVLEEKQDGQNSILFGCLIALGIILFYIIFHKPKKR